MRIERSLHNPISAFDVFEMMCEVEYQERKCADAGALNWDVSVDRSASGAVIRARRTMPSHDFPALLRKFVPKGATSTETITWGAADRDGGRIGELRVAFHGTPAAMNGTVCIVPQGRRITSVVIDAEFRANVPLVGGKVEGFAVPIILRVIDAEEQTGQAWVARSA